MRLSSFRFFALLAAALVLAFGAGLWASQQKTTGVSPGAPPKWEYRVVTEPAPAGGSVLTAAGADGWELVAVISQDQYSGNVRQTNVYYYFKRARWAF